MTPEDFDRRYAYDVAHAEATLLRDGAVHPLFVVVCRDGRNIPIAGDFSDEASKAAAFATVRLACIAEDAIMVAHCTEACIVLGELAPGIAPSQSDGQVEVLLVIASARMGELLPPERPSPGERRAARALLERATKRVTRGKTPFVH